MASTVAAATLPRLERVGGRAWVVTAGTHLGDEAATALAMLVERALGRGCLEMVIDLTGTVAIDSTGAIALCEIEIALTEAQADVAVAATAADVLATLRSTQLDLVWPVAPDRAGALADVLAAPVGMQPA